MPDPLAIIVAIVTVLISIGALIVAVLARSVAAKANDISQKANSLVSEEIERAKEHHDVRWHGRWVHEGYQLANDSSTDHAFSVRFSVDIDSLHFTGSADKIAPGESMTATFPAVLQAHQLADQAALSKERNVQVAVWWMTSLGTPKHTTRQFQSAVQRQPPVYRGGGPGSGPLT